MTRRSLFSLLFGALAGKAAPKPPKGGWLRRDLHEQYRTGTLGSFPPFWADVPFSNSDVYDPDMALAKMNEMIDRWKTQRLKVPA